jgi:hypothetical protein
MYYIGICTNERHKMWEFLALPMLKMVSSAVPTLFKTGVVS